MDDPLGAAEPLDAPLDGLAAGVAEPADVAVEGPDAAELAGAELAPADSGEAEPEAGFLAESRKSVTYQPVPFSAKPAAVTCLTSLGLPH